MANRMLTILLLVSAICFHCSTTVAQLVPWRLDRPLTWDDFRGKKPHKTKFSAATHSSLRYNLSVGNNDSFRVTVHCSFNPDRSWKKHKRLKPYLLKHEQSHFDITEIYARKLRKAFGKYQAKHTITYASTWKLQLIHENMCKAWRHCEHKYDRQTKHSRRRDKQEEWNKKIAGQLSELNEYEAR